jgi:L-lactate utilization protein LutB
MEKNVALHMEILGKRTAEALQKNGFLAEYLPDSAAARQRLLQMIPDGAAVGFGGSMTVKHLDVQDELRKRGCPIYDHGLAKDPAEAMSLRRKQLTCDVFLTSSNAITRDGRLYNVDGGGNRVAAMTFGPGEVIIVAGVNKITANLEEAMERVRSYAAPMNNLRLNFVNPCTKTGYCMDCSSPKRICNIGVTLHKCPLGMKTTVLLVGETLGY